MQKQCYCRRHCQRREFSDHAPKSPRQMAKVGTITAAYDPRQVQLGVKILW